MSSPISLNDVVHALKEMNRGKSPDPDCLHIEAFIYGGQRLCLYVCFLFNLFLKYGYVPSVFTDAVLIPLLKDKNKNLSDVNNYRAITLSNSISKIFDIFYC